MRLFLRQSTVGREPLAVAMSGVRMGERLLQIGVGDPAIIGTLSAKPGLTGESSVVVPDEAAAVRARRAISDSGALVNVLVHSLDRLPFEDGALDVVVIHDRDGLLDSGSTQKEQVFADSLRVLRPGGRLVVFERGTPSGFTAMFQARKPVADSPDRTIQALEAAGFRAVRMLGDRDTYRFIEGLKPQADLRK